MFQFLVLKPEAFGLDISDLSLKIVKLKRKNKKLSLASYGEFPLKPGILDKGEVRDSKALTKAIQEAYLKVKGGKLRTRYVVASLPEEKSFLQVIQMPKMNKPELKKAATFEAENYIPLPIKEVYLDSQKVLPVKNHLDHADVLIAALPKKVVDPYVTAIKEAGLTPQALEIESLAVGRSLIKDNLNPFPVLLVDLGATRTSFIIFSGHSVRFTSSIPVSSQKFTEAIARHLKIELEEAEKLKIKYGLDKKTKAAKRIFEALIPSLTDLIEQIKKYLHYYQTHNVHEHLSSTEQGVTKILLCGGGANLKGLVDFLARELKIPVELGNPWVNILPKPLKEVPEISFKKSLSYTTALGLALRGIQPPPSDHD